MYRLAFKGLLWCFQYMIHCSRVSHKKNKFQVKWKFSNWIKNCQKLFTERVIHETYVIPFMWPLSIPMSCTADACFWFVRMGSKSISGVVSFFDLLIKEVANEGCVSIASSHVRNQANCRSRCGNAKYLAKVLSINAS